MIGVDFDFARYVAERRGEIEQRARNGAAYSFGGELKARRMLVSTRPVTMAIEATTRRWNSTAKDSLLGEATLVTDQSYSSVLDAGLRAARALGMSCPPIYIVPNASDVEARVLGTDSDPYLFIAERYADELSAAELTALVGHLLGHVQNNHVLLGTALFYLRHDAMFFIRWIVQPAIIALQAWSRRAEISCDRASLICVRDLDAAISMIVRTGTGELDTDVVGYLEGLEGEPGAGRIATLFRSHPDVPKRVAALRLFAESSLYQRIAGNDNPTGRSSEDVDQLVSELLSKF